MKAQLEQTGFQCPVRLRYPEQMRSRCDELFPDLTGRWRLCCGEVSPGTAENGFEDEHRHIAAQAIAVPSQVPDHLGQRMACVRAQWMELQGVAPGRKVRITPMGEQQDAAFPALDRKKTIGVAAVVGECSGQETLRVLPNPGVVDRRMIGNEIENQTDTAPVQSPAEAIHIGPASNAGIGTIVSHRIGRAYDVLERPAWKQPVVILEAVILPARDGTRSRAALPQTHEPDQIKPRCANPIELFFADVFQTYLLPVFLGKLLQPRPGR